MSPAPGAAPRISLVVAASINGVIGVDGDLPWRLPDDLRHFKRLTLGKPVVMGRKTYESIGRPLPDRHNIVITRSGREAAGCTVVSSPEAAVDAAGEVPELMIIGGGSIYDAFIARAERIYLTRVLAQLDGDTFFELPQDGWRVVSSERHPADDRHDYAFEFLRYDRYG